MEASVNCMLQLLSGLAELSLANRVMGAELRGPTNRVATEKPNADMVALCTMILDYARAPGLVSTIQSVFPHGPSSLDELYRVCRLTAIELEALPRQPSTIGEPCHDTLYVEAQTLAAYREANIGAVAVVRLGNWRTELPASIPHLRFLYLQCAMEIMDRLVLLLQSPQDPSFVAHSALCEHFLKTWAEFVNKPRVSGPTYIIEQLGLSKANITTTVSFLMARLPTDQTNISDPNFLAALTHEDGRLAIFEGFLESLLNEAEGDTVWSSHEQARGSSMEIDSDREFVEASGRYESLVRRTVFLFYIYIRMFP